MTLDRRVRSAADSPGDITRRELYFFNLYRCLEAAIYATLVFSAYAGEWVRVAMPLLGQVTAVIYFGIALLLLISTDRLRTRLVGGISAALLLDIVAASLVLIALGGYSLVPMMLLVNVGIAALLLPRRAYLFAALAGVGVTAPYGYARLIDAESGHPGAEIIAIVVAYFIVAALLRYLGGHMRATEDLAAQRGVDLLNLEQINDLIAFFQTDVPAAFLSGPEAATDRDAKADFAKSNAAVIEALQSYAAWMKSDLLPRSNGDFRLGADTFRKKLAYDEMVDLPLARLLQIASDDLHKNQAEFARIAKEIDPTKTPTEVLAELATIHPAPDKLLDAFHDTFNSLVTFIDTHHIITIPSTVEPTLEETPPFMRATTQASMDSPGPFETHSTKAYFNVTLPEKDWTTQHIAEHMAAFNVGTILSTSVHEAYPGHYVQFLWQSQFPSKIRKLLGANTNIEGWAHYTEQMMLDEGYAAAPPNATPEQIRESHLIRLGQLQDALLRDARFVNAIKLHTGEGEPDGKWTIEQCVDFFVKQGYQSPSVALVETKRGTSDPTYLYYTLGKLEIMKLREDLKQKEGPAFNLEQFHDNFMRQGLAPIKIIRKAMLHNDSPVL